MSLAHSGTESEKQARLDSRETTRNQSFAAIGTLLRCEDSFFRRPHLVPFTPLFPIPPFRGDDSERKLQYIKTRFRCFRSRLRVPRKIRLIVPAAALFVVHMLLRMFVPSQAQESRSQVSHGSDASRKNGLTDLHKRCV